MNAPIHPGINTSVESTASEPVEVRQILRVLRKYVWFILAFNLIVLAGTAAYLSNATPVYRSTALLLIEPQTSNVMSIDDLIGIETDNPDYYETQFRLLRSRVLAGMVIDELKLWHDPHLLASSGGAAGAADEQTSDSGFWQSLFDRLRGVEQVDGAATPPASGGSPEAGNGSATKAEQDTDAIRHRDRILDAFLGDLQVTSLEKTKLVEISFESPDPELAAIVPNTLANMYISNNLDTRMTLTTRASSWLNDRLSTLRQTLEESEQRLVKFRKENGLIDLNGDVGEINERELVQASSELSQAQSELAVARTEYRDIEAAGDDPALLQSTPAVQSDALYQSTLAERNEVQRELQQLKNRYGERHPRVLDVQARIDAVNDALAVHARRVGNAIEKNYRLAQQHVAVLEARISNERDSIQLIGEKKIDLEALQREVITNRELFETFYSRMKEARSADGLLTANASITDPATQSSDPVKPRPLLIFMLALFGGGVLSVVGAFLANQLDHTVQSTRDLEGRLQIRLIGIIPRIGKRRWFRRSSKVSLTDPRRMAAVEPGFVEGVNTTRTSLSIDDENGPNKVFMITSSVPGEGKSTLSVNLAYMFGQFEKTLLIDCDMRRPTVAAIAGLGPKTTGLHNLIAATHTARQCISVGALGDIVDVLPVGAIPRQPLELLSSKRFKKIIEALREHYDRIIIDSPPMQAVSDALVLSRVCDSVVYVVKSHSTSIDLVERGISRLRQIDAPLTGVVVTQVSTAVVDGRADGYQLEGQYGYGSTHPRARNSRYQADLSPAQLKMIRNDERDVVIDLVDLEV